MCCLIGYFSRSNYWIGLWLPDPLIGCGACSSQSRTDLTVTDACTQCRKQWTWQDGSAMLDSNNNMVLDAWHFNEPSGGQNCARLARYDDDRDTYTWKDVQCSSRFHYICKTSKSAHVHDFCANCENCVYEIHTRTALYNAKHP